MVFKFFFRTARNLPRVAAAGTLGAVGWSRFLVDHDVPKAPSINAQVSAVGDARAGTVTLFSDRSGEGRPVLLIHSVNAAASAHEMAPIFDRLAVVGLGLLGGSVALGARARGLAREVRGVDPAADDGQVTEIVAKAEDQYEEPVEEEPVAEEAEEDV